MSSRLAFTAPFIVCALFVAALLPAPAAAAPVLQLSPLSRSPLKGLWEPTSRPRRCKCQTTRTKRLRWTVAAPTATWLTVSPTGGTNTGTLTVTFKTSSLAAGTYSASFKVQSHIGQPGKRVREHGDCDGAAADADLPRQQDGRVNERVSGASELQRHDLGRRRAGDGDGHARIGQFVSRRVDGGRGHCQIERHPDGQLRVLRDGDFHTAPTAPPAHGHMARNRSITCPADAIHILPGHNIQSFVDYYPGNTTFCLRAGIHPISTPPSHLCPAMSSSGSTARSGWDWLGDHRF